MTLDRQNREYYACDAGCLDPPVKLSKETRRFPVKLTDPVTAVLYITSDYEHMRELKHTIHVKEVNDGECYLAGCYMYSQPSPFRHLQFDFITISYATSHSVLQFEISH